jgi:hypothetical protein
MFVTAAFDVVILGKYGKYGENVDYGKYGDHGEEAGVRRR